MDVKGEALPLRALSMAIFAMGVASLAVVGAVPAIAASLHVAVGKAGLLVAAFALTFAISAPFMQIIFSHYSRRSLLLTGLAMLALGAFGCAAAPDFACLFIARMLTGLGAAMVSPVASSLGSTLVAPARQGYALAVVFGGMTIASVVGVPLALLVVQYGGWRWMFGAIGTLAVVAAAILAVTIKDRTPGHRLAMAGLGEALRSPGTASSLLSMVLAMASFHASNTMIAPLLSTRFHATPGAITWAFAVAGVAGLAGNQLARRVAHRFTAQRTLYIALGLIVGAPLLLSLGPSALWLALAAMVSWALAIDLLLPSQQRKMVELRPDMRGLMLSLNSSALFLGAALGSVLSSWTSHGFGLTALAPVSAALAVAALMVAWLPARQPRTAIQFN